MKRTFLFAGLVIFSIFFSPLNFAWNALAHMVIADIAYKQLKPEVKRKVDSLVNIFHSEYDDMNYFQQLAYWPDAIRSQKIEVFTRWHFINIPLQENDVEQKALNDTDNAVWALKKINKIITNARANPYERARFLAFFAHIVGDLHQPLHTVTYISADYPEGDEGGNLFFVKYNGRRVKLHSVWDAGVDVFKLDANLENMNLLSRQISATYPKEYFHHQLNQLDPESWLKEGMDNARQFVYATKEDQALTSFYIENAKRLSKQQVALAGYRLGNLLNQMLA